MLDSSELARARAEILKAPGHPSRLIILEALQEGPRCACELAELVSGAQATVSRHLDVLLRARGV